MINLPRENVRVFPHFIEKYVFRRTFHMKLGLFVAQDNKRSRTKAQFSVFGR